ncbi:SDR family NAD(P)-dependent oxidoreductase [Streptomyces olivoreticuli]|uniref:SDR family NAD(P)-dependent oxidoreductase n=1 Tax=Streptomyces olivoreticuli TaxID=68246 RepID=UPI002658A534|nr:SDR family NAD(P)-dependent oxidoreductase [Streptomyces olivoreticuli]WKK23714.1 SDR family NAD(P)-dependent oxidoreductase [Streptomyces olivoreticuli]
MLEPRGAVGILTGASRGVGPYIAEHLARAGVRLALVARTEDGLRETARRIRHHGHEPLVVPADISDEDDQRRVVDTVAGTLGPPSLLVNNAAVEHISRFQDATIEDIKRVILVNLFGTEALTRLVLPHLLSAGRGHIVTIGSVAGRTAYPYGTVNSSTKHGVVGFTWSLREELRGTGVGVSAVYPTLISDVGISARWQAGRRPPLLGRVGPDEVARAVLKCIRKNKVEITVSPPMEKIADVMGAVSPRLTSWAARHGGVHSYLRKVAETQERSR